MLSINTNLSSLIAQGSMKSSTNKLNQAIERMTTGFKINHAKDNAANYSISTNMTTKIGAYNVAEDNAAMGLDLISTAEGTLSQIEDKLQRLRALAEQASNGTYGEQSLNAINAEANALVDEINRLYSTAEYNGLKLFGSEEASQVAPIAMFAMTRTTALNPSYTDAEVAAMIPISDVSSFTPGECYSISNAEELKKLATLINSGVDSAGAIFVLANDIDLSGILNWDCIGCGWVNDVYYSFKGTFDGNGHVIKNLKIDKSSGNQGLFGSVNNGEIKNVGLENISIKSVKTTGALTAQASGTIISNCFATNVSIEQSGSGYVGGLIGNLQNQSVKNCYVQGEVVSAGSRVGGLVGYSAGDIINCYSSATVTAEDEVGGLCGFGSDNDISNSYATGTVIATNGSAAGLCGVLSSSAGYNSIVNSYSTATVQATGDVAGLFCRNSSSASTDLQYSNIASTLPDPHAQLMNLDELKSFYTSELMGYTEANGWTIVDGTPLLSWQKEAQSVIPEPDTPAAGTGGGGTTPNNPSFTPPSYAPDTIVLQIGAASNWASQVGVSTKLSLVGLDELRMIGLNLTTDYLGQIDDMLGLVSEKQTHFGATSNRLESVLEEITIQRDNLVSSRSTIRDADIAEVSSTYIRQQILQQASATLLATANQSPSIALQLI